MSNPNEDRNTSSWPTTARHNPYVEEISGHSSETGEPYRHNTTYGMSPPQVRYPTNVTPISESYTVFPVGHGNFLKVYHSENEQPTFNNYELFSSSSFIPHHSVRSQSVNNAENEQLNYQNHENATNMLINQLVTNWTPNVSGTYSPFGEQQTTTAKNFAVNSEAATDVSNLQETVLMNNVRVSPKTNGSFENSSTPNLPEVKKRIVAEVKPMRMSYSDVLSKNVSINKKISNGGNGNSSNDSNNQTKNAKIISEKKINSNFSEKKSHSSSDEKDKIEVRSKKVENQSNYRNEDNSSSFSNAFQKEKRKSGSDENNKENISNQLNKTAKKQSQNLKGKTKNTQTQNENTKRRSNKRETDDEVFIRNNLKENDKEFYYNVTKNESNSDRHYKTSQHASNSKKSRQNITTQKSNFRTEKSSFYSKRNQKNRKNEKYELIMKFAEKWFEYTMKILTWLFYLVYDIIVLGFGMVYDRLKHSYFCLCSCFCNLQQELRNNSGKPNAWIKNLFKDIDSKFAKNSRLAFWRKFYKKKPQEPTTDFYKNGRLPQTGDEAMYSLLNCKGKDAYSILGVTIDSSQEQIRKHYKKIAVLVHPDKNKQPGAEEAFKVLQRAFELIGEPENRKSYDQSLAEALNAEKAWSELHELLSQLQSKIAEAANTIRCSSCGLRHPRKLTERPHYAARECSSCKIRHSAREGDIWAETSIFGLRWKYLALMEGKVYDITEWANCQKGALSHLQPNSHIVQYRIVRGGQQQQQQQQQQEKERMKRDPSEPSLDEFLDNLYSGQNPQNSQQGTSRRRSKRN